MTISFSRIGVVNKAPQCRIHGKIGHFGPFDNNFSPPGANFGKSPGSLGSQPQQAVRPPQALHPGLNLNNWAKNFPSQDEVMLLSIHTFENICHVLMSEDVEKLFLEHLTRTLFMIFSSCFRFLEKEIWMGTTHLRVFHLSPLLSVRWDNDLTLFHLGAVRSTPTPRKCVYS